MNGSQVQYTNTLSSTASSMYKTIRDPPRAPIVMKQYEASSSAFDPSSGADSRVLVRVLIFALFYILASLVVLASIIYEYERRDGWLLKSSDELVNSLENLNSDVRKVPISSLKSFGIVESGESTLFSNLFVFRLRLFMSLFIGMSTGLWMLITRANFELCRWRRRQFIKKTSSVPGSVPLTGSTRMQHLFRDGASVTFSATKPVNPADNQYFSSFFASHPPLPQIPQLPQQQLTQQQHAHLSNEHSAHLNGVQAHLGYQHSLQRSAYGDGHHLSQAAPHQQLSHHLSQHQQYVGHHHQGVFPHQSSSSATSSTSVSSGHTFAYPNPNLVLDNHWGEHASSVSSHRTGNETAV